RAETAGQTRFVLPRGTSCLALPVAYDAFGDYDQSPIILEAYYFNASPGFGLFDFVILVVMPALRNGLDPSFQGFLCSRP
ncbi:MAG: hypothetical protein VX257_03960, partial [Planctomycetota bacterium]|nr:hypothetical protein [Planctomycetota bacterium]